MHKDNNKLSVKNIINLKEADSEDLKLSVFVFKNTKILLVQFL